MEKKSPFSMVDRPMLRYKMIYGLRDEAAIRIGRPERVHRTYRSVCIDTVLLKQFSEYAKSKKIDVNKFLQEAMRSELLRAYRERRKEHKREHKPSTSLSR